MGNIDAYLAAMRDTIPRIWWNLYQGAMQAGWDNNQAFILVQTWILAQNPHGSKPNSIPGPEADK